MDIRLQKELISIAISASLEAGKEILKIYAGDFEVELKEDDSPLTVADRNAHNTISSFLEKTDYPILSEEGRSIPYNERKEWKNFWMVDPLDGTKEFVKRNGDFTVNIAMISDDRSLFGVIYIPVSDTLYYGGEDIGSYRIDKFSLVGLGSFDNLINSSLKLPLEKPQVYTICASRSHLSTETVEYIDLLKSKHGDIILISRGSSLKICMVAEGSADEYPRFAPTMEWDIAAGHAIILGVGKDIIDWNDKITLPYNKEKLLNNYFIVC